MSSKHDLSWDFAIPLEIPWSEINTRYFAFAAKLPEPLGLLARDKRIFIGKGKSLKFDSLAEIHPLVSCIPWLFADAFPLISNEDLLNIAEASVYLSLAMFLADGVRDGQLLRSTPIELLHKQLSNAGRCKFWDVMTSHPLFWDKFDSYQFQYKQAIDLELAHQGKVVPYTLSDMFKIGSGKVALFKTITTALAYCGNRDHFIKPLEIAIDYLTAAMQLGNDIADWPKDYQSGNFTFPLTQIIPKTDWPKPTLSLKKISQLVNNSVLLEELMDQVADWFNEAIISTHEMNCPYWDAYVASCLDLTKRYKKSLIIQKLLYIFNN